jgi:hypothetical protein
MFNFAQTPAPVIPAKAGISVLEVQTQMPACAGMTVNEVDA